MLDERPEAITVDGVKYFRVFGNCVVDSRSHVTYPYASLRLKGQIDPTDAEHVSTRIRGSKHKYDNVPIIQNAEHERRLCDKYGLRRE